MNLYLLSTVTTMIVQVTHWAGQQGSKNGTNSCPI